MIYIPDEIHAYAKANHLSVAVETWFQDGQRYTDWHYTGVHRTPCDTLNYPQHAIMLKEHKNFIGGSIRVQAFLCECTPPGEHRVYRPIKRLYEWRDTNKKTGVVYRDPLLLKFLGLEDTFKASDDGEG